MGMVWEGWFKTATSLLAAAQCKACDYSWVLGRGLLGPLALNRAELMNCPRWRLQLTRINCLINTARAISTHHA